MAAGGFLSFADVWGAGGIVDERLLGRSVFAGLALVFGGMVWLYMFCRCTKCKYRLFRHAVRKMELLDGLKWFLYASTCPNCGAKGRPSAMPSSEIDRLQESAAARRQAER